MKDKQKRDLSRELKKDFRLNGQVYLMAVPMIVFFLIFNYTPMAGIVVAFKRYNIVRGIFASPWVGFDNFIKFFNSYYFWTLLRNTVWIKVLEILIAFPMPIILAILLNEINHRKFQSIIQSLTFFPYFISTVVVAGIVINFTKNDGLITNFVRLFGYVGGNLLQNQNAYRPIYIATVIWRTVGYQSIVFVAALAAIDYELYDAAKIDGANKFQQLFRITIPGIMTTIITMLILKFGTMMNVDFEIVLLLYNEAIYDVADVIQTFTFRKGLAEFDFAYATAVGLFNSVINMAFLLTANKLGRKFAETSLF